MEGQHYRSILKRVGIVLIAVGLADVAVLIYCIVHRTTYRSSLPLALIFGVFLLRGNLRAASTVRWFSALCLSATIAAGIAWPAIQPLDLTLTEIRLKWSDFAASLVAAIFMIALAYWVIRELGREPVQAASALAGIKRRDMRVPAAVGVVLVAAGVACLNVFLSGESAERAKSMAEKLVGPGYRLHVGSMRVSESGHTESVSGVVIAWNDREIREIPFKWKEDRD